MFIGKNNLFFLLTHETNFLNPVHLMFKKGILTAIKKKKITLAAIHFSFKLKYTSNSVLKTCGKILHHSCSLLFCCVNHI